MTLTFDWFLPTSGDGRTIYGRGHSLPLAQAQALPIPGDRPPDIEYLGQVAGAAEQLDPEEIASAQQILGRTESAGQDRMHALHASYRRSGVASDLEVYPHLWAGVGLVRGGAGTALVGSHAQVADLIEEYAALGISEFILSGYPHLEEAYWFGEGVLPELRRRGVWEPVGGERELEVAGSAR